MVKAKAIKVYVLGGPEVLKWEEVEVGEPKEGEIRVRNKAIGVNFIDVYFRKGVYATDVPFTPGREAVGVVTAVGPGLTGREVGDIVAYAGNPMGSYSEEQILPASVVVPVPPSIDHKVAASIMLKGMTAHMLLRHSLRLSMAILSLFMPLLVEWVHYFVSGQMHSAPQSLELFQPKRKQPRQQKMDVTMS